MRHSIQGWLIAASVPLITASCVMGCGSFFGCDDTATCEPLDIGSGGAAGQSGAGGTGGVGGASDVGGMGGVSTCMEDPADGEMINEENKHCGIWASSSLGDDNNPGTRELPVKTLAKATALAGAELGPGRVYACAEVYPEAVVLGGVSLFGGFRCSEPGWPYLVDEDERAEIQAPPAVAALVLAQSDVVSQIRDLDVIASDAITPGGSSIAVFALEGSKAFFRRSKVIAGNGADGLDGEDGSHDNQPAPQGLTGNDGTAACLLEVGLGGGGVTKLCPDGTQSIGGQGGDANAIAASDGAQGFEPPNPNVQGYGAGGKGEDSAQGTACTPGSGGAHGDDGIDGMGAVSAGRLTSAGYLGTPGGDGQAGFPGQGGGGGGASLGAACIAAGGPKNGGAGGGSGGSGGCGGKAGRGGQPGGSSFGFALLSNDIRVDKVLVQSGDGGNGGHGGLRQSGGKGGLPGYGGTGFGGAVGAQQACGGGIGGYGGDGGAGGGGRGGHSSCVGAPLRYDLKVVSVTRIVGKRGEGGIGGNPGLNNGEPGDDGALATLDP